MSFSSPISPQQTLVSDPGLHRVVPECLPETVNCKYHECRRCSKPYFDAKDRFVELSVERPSPPGSLVAVKGRLALLKENIRRHPIITSAIVVGGLTLLGLIIGLSTALTNQPPRGLQRDSGLVVLDRGDQSQWMDLIFQHASGQLRNASYDGESWLGGTKASGVLSPTAPKPRKGTPLMAVTTNNTETNEITWRIIYADENNNLQESISVDGSRTWTQGPLGLGLYNISTSPNTGISSCRSGIWRADSLSLIILYGGADGLNHMLTLSNTTAWHPTHTFVNSNSSSGCECTIRGSSRLDTWMISKNNALIQSSFEYNISSTNPTFPPGEWTTTTTYANKSAIRAPTSISAIKYKDGTTNVHFQRPDHFIQELHVPDPLSATSPNNTSSVPALPVALTVGTRPAVPGSKLGSVDLVTHPPGGGEGHNSNVFFIAEDDPRQVAGVSWNFGNDVGGEYWSDLEVVKVGK